MDAQTLKIECLKLAAEKLPLLDAPKAVEAAEAYWQWINRPTTASLQTPPTGIHSKS